MGYCDYLKGLLQPTGLYELETGAGAAELEVIGAQLDEVFARLEELSSEMLPLTAQGCGLEYYEKLLPYRAMHLTRADERRALSALLRIRSGCFTRETLQDTVSGCGLTALVREGTSAQTVVVSFPQNRGIPEGIEQIQRRVEEILPCQLAVEYEYIYAIWREIVECLGSWGGIEGTAATWRELEIYLPE